MKRIFGAVLAFAFVLSVGINLVQVYNNYKISHISEIRKESSNLSQEGFNEILASYIQNIRDNTVDNARQQGKLEGIISLVNRIPPQESEISSIWHSGYQRGLEQNEFVAEMNYDKGYAAGITKGREDSMKAINNIASSSTDFKAAFQDFMKNANKENTEEPKPKPKK